MVCISTRQNTANLVPFMQFDFDVMLLLETDYAKKENWSSGLSGVLSGRGKQIKRYPLGKGTDLSEMLSKIRELVSDVLKVCWNMGGGQKMQQMALLKVFQERLDIKIQDWACYADPSLRRVYTVQGDKQNLSSTESEIRTEITLDDVLDVFGLEKRTSNDPLMLWRCSDPDTVPAKDRFRDLSLFWNTEKRHRIFEWELSKKGSEPQVLKGLKHGYPDYFEQIVQNDVAKILRHNSPNHHVTEAWANVRVKNRRGKEIAEWDVVLVTDFGTLIILDAKTGTFSSKDEHARLFNLERATGFYGEFWLVIPYLLEDMRDDGFYAKYGQHGQDNPKIPFELSGLNSRFLAVTGQDNPFYIKKMKKGKVHILEAWETSENAKNVLKITDIGSLLDVLRLKKG